MIDFQPLIDEFKDFGPGYMGWWLLTDRLRWLRLIRFPGSREVIRSCRRYRREWCQGVAQRRD